MDKDIERIEVKCESNHIMKKTIVLLAVLLQSVVVCAQTVIPLKSPSEILNAEVRVEGRSVQIGLSEKGDKVVDVKTLQLDLEEDILAGNWLVTNQAGKTVNQTWQPVYGERSLVTDRYNELELSLQ